MRGVAALEFALCAPLLLTMLAAISDLGLAMRSKMLLATGVDNAASYAILTQGGATATTLQAVVQDTSTLTDARVTASTPACYCAS
jgi:Flp pilus assembly protein TadG